MSGKGIRFIVSAFSIRPDGFGSSRKPAAHGGVGVNGGEGKGEGFEGLFVERLQAPGGDEGDGGAVCRILQRPGDFKADQRTGKPGLRGSGRNPVQELAGAGGKEQIGGKGWACESGGDGGVEGRRIRRLLCRTGNGMEKVGRIGLHVFYRTYGGGWS